MTDQVVEDSVLAASRSRPCAMLGITALRAGSKNAAHRGLHEQQHVDQADPLAGLHQQHQEHDAGARQIGGDHHALAAEPVVHDPRHRGRQNCGSSCSTTARATALALPVSSSSRL